MDTQTIQTIAGFTSSMMFATSQIPMLVKVYKTRDLQSYSLGNLVIGNIANLIHWVYLVTVPGPLWYLHAFFTVTSTIMLIAYLRYAGFRLTANRPSLVRSKMKLVTHLLESSR